MCLHVFFASILVDTLSETLDPQQRRNLMVRVGQKMADQLVIPPASDIEERLQIANAFADKLGAETQVKKESGIATIQSFSCPLGRTVRLENCVCGVMASFFSSAIGTEVEECCDRGERLRCKFVVKKLSSD